MIEVNNLTTRPIREEFIIKLAEKVLKGEHKKGLNLSIALVGQGKIKALNKKYRGKNRMTDVLAFGDNDGLGEIVICLREVNKNAKRLGYAFEGELARVLIHGILHLLRYDHEGLETAAEKMKKKEEFYLTETSK